jgi:ABC-type phosphate/phosphonate transport system substrate-binding protein
MEIADMDKRFALGIALTTLAAAVFAADKTGGLTVATYTPPAQTAPTKGGALFADEALVLSAPPRDTPEDGARRFGPVADYLGKVLGRKVVYQHPGGWGVYQGAMQRGVYDIVFDGPHFNGWRLEKLGHHVLVKLPGEFPQAVVVRADEARITQMRQLAGRTVCAHAPPNLGTLVMLNEFDNPARQPVIRVTDGYNHIYQALLDGKCTAAVLPVGHVKKSDKDGARTRIVFQGKPMPNQAFSAGPRLSAEEREKIAEALLAPEAEAALARFREAYSLGKQLVRARDEEYMNLGQVLKDQWGYY